MVLLHGSIPSVLRFGTTHNAYQGCTDSPMIEFRVDLLTKACVSLNGHQKERM